ncbi:hypothetical protein [Mycobacterium haemophilum]|uniref:hypothetical protein n=1 Tax=Mycobacterium haemophilum TaxID=29311 RepID=UPI000AC8FCFE|nr:hypothetical protein [Mycobacterium haemophilum]
MSPAVSVSTVSRRVSLQELAMCAPPDRMCASPGGQKGSSSRAAATTIVVNA